MNALKSVLRISRSESSQTSVQALYEEVKSWDEARARMLQKHLKVVQLAMDALDVKVSQVDKYIQGLDKLMSIRIQQITSYCKNGVNDSQFFLVPCSLNSLKPCHQLLKHLLMEQSQREQNLSKKGAAMAVILEKLKKLKSFEDGVSEQENWGSSVKEIKSSIRFLIDCELPDLIVDVLDSCKAVSAAFTEEKHFYLAVEKFVKMADKQLQKHREIGRELLALVCNFSKREKEMRVKLREIMIQWVREDLEDKIFQEQLRKAPSESLIDEYYDIENLIPDHEEMWKGQSLSDYLQSLQILPFREHERLVVYSRQVFYNAKIEARIVLTVQKQAYMFRIQTEQPDFIFVLSKHIKIRQAGPLVVQVSQFHKTLLLREATDFQFTLQFNLQLDLKQFQQKCRYLGCQFDSK